MISLQPLHEVSLLEEKAPHPQVPSYFESPRETRGKMERKKRRIRSAFFSPLLFLDASERLLRSAGNGSTGLGKCKIERKTGRQAGAGCAVFPAAKEERRSDQGEAARAARLAMHQSDSEAGEGGIGGRSRPRLCSRCLRRAATERGRSNKRRGDAETNKRR